MSSQGSNSLVGYTFSRAAVRDSGDWIALKKQVRVAADQKTLVTSSATNPTPPLSTTDPWLTYSSGFRLTRQLGQYKGGGTTFAPCLNCSGACPVYYLVDGGRLTSVSSLVIDGGGLNTIQTCKLDGGGI